MSSKFHASNIFGKLSVPAFQPYPTREDKISPESGREEFVSCISIQLTLCIPSASSHHPNHTKDIFSGSYIHKLSHNTMHVKIKYCQSPVVKKSVLPYPFSSLFASHLSKMSSEFHASNIFGKLSVPAF
jgi:hypothetical protein